jgi:hypothetical protein
VADPAYTEASNQQSYQQLLWKSFMLRKIVRFFLVCTFELFGRPKLLTTRNDAVEESVADSAVLEAKIVNKQFGRLRSAFVLNPQVLLPTPYPTVFQAKRIQ